MMRDLRDAAIFTALFFLAVAAIALLSLAVALLIHAVVGIVTFLFLAIMAGCYAVT